MLQINKNWKEIKSRSVVRVWEPFFYLAVLLLSFWVLARFENISDAYLSVYVILILTAVMTGVEFWKNKRVFSLKNQESLSAKIKNTFISYCGVLFGVVLMFFAFWFFPEYDFLKYKDTIGQVQWFVVGLVLVLAGPMIFLSNWFLGHKNDGTYNLGLFFTLQIEKINWNIFRDGILEWVIRLIFLTLNFKSSIYYLGLYRDNLFNPTFFQSLNFFQGVMIVESMIFMIILMVIVPGYLFSWRLIGTDTKKIDSTWFAWTFLLICYQPFIGKIFSEIFNYESSQNWTTLLNPGDFITILFAVVILFAAFVHLWSEAALGIRSSNLSNKGIITNGIFGFTKHPVYLSKIIGWFFISLPFFNGSTVLESLQLGIAFLFVCAIFAARSLSEERLLATDPVYVEYAMQMDKQATFAFVNKFLPFMSFRWRYDYWVRNNMLKY